MSYIEGHQTSKTNFSANGQTLDFDVAALNTVRFEFSGTYNFTAAFEASTDGTVWFPFQVAMTNAMTIATTHATANATQAYEANTSAVAKVRIRLTAFTSAATHKVLIAGTPASIDPIPAITFPSSQVIATPSGTAIAVTTAASTNASSQKSTAGNLFELSVSNPTATAISVKLYNKATAPTVGTDIPVVTQTVAAGATVALNFGTNGKRFATGIAMAATALPAAADTGVAVAGVQIHGTYI